MKLRLISLLLLLLGGLPSAAPAVEALACNLSALTHYERERQHVLGGKLKDAATRRDELSNGYALTIDPARLSLAELSEWVAFEARCCPFLDFEIAFKGDGGPVTLRLTGKGPEVKAFLQLEIRAFQ